MLIERHSCGAIDLASAIAHVETNYLDAFRPENAFRPETDVVDLRDEQGVLVWQKTSVHP